MYCHPIYLSGIILTCYVRRSPDGQCLILSSRDGYCTIIVFDEIMPAYHTQQHVLQLQSIAHQHSVPLTHSTSSGATPAATPSTSFSALPPTPIVPMKRPELLVTPTANIDEISTKLNTAANAKNGHGEASGDAEKNTEGPPKKKRRVALTHVGDLDP